MADPTETFPDAVDDDPHLYVRPAEATTITGTAILGGCGLMHD